MAGCDRRGAVPRKLPDSEAADGTKAHYVCRFHHRLFLGIKFAVAAGAIGLFLWAFFHA